jgi:hypothetical protein
MSEGSGDGPTQPCVTGALMRCCRCESAHWHTSAQIGSMTASTAQSQRCWGHTQPLVPSATTPRRLVFNPSLRQLQRLQVVCSSAPWPELPPSAWLKRPQLPTPEQQEALSKRREAERSEQSSQASLVNDAPATTAQVCSSCHMHAWRPGRLALQSLPSKSCLAHSLN